MRRALLHHAPCDGVIARKPAVGVVAGGDGHHNPVNRGRVVLRDHLRVEHLVFHIMLNRRRAAPDNRRAERRAEHRAPRLHLQQPDDHGRHQRDEHRHFDLAADQHHRAAGGGQRELRPPALRILDAKRQIQRHHDERHGERIRIQHGGGDVHRQAAGQHQQRHQFAPRAGEATGDAQRRARAEDIQHRLHQHQRVERLRHAEGKDQLVKGGQHQREAPLVGKAAQIEVKIRVVIKIAVRGQHLRALVEHEIVAAGRVFQQIAHQQVNGEQQQGERRGEYPRGAFRPVRAHPADGAPGQQQQRQRCRISQPQADQAVAVVFPRVGENQHVDQADPRSESEKAQTASQEFGSQGNPSFSRRSWYCPAASTNS